MRNLRPAFLVLLLSWFGLCVPAGVAQSKAQAKKKTPAGKHSSSHKPTTSSKSRSKATTRRTSGSHAETVSSRTRKKPTRRSRRQRGQQAPTSDRISEIQTALAKDGSFPGQPNGKWDGDTSVALRKFQATHGLNPTGKLDALSLERLGLGSQTAGVAAPTPPPGATSRLTSSVSAAPTQTAERQ